MNGNILDELMNLLNHPGPINWALAGQLADHVVGAPTPIDPWIADEYLELVRLAQLRVPGAARYPTPTPVLVDSRAWAGHHLRSFSYLVEPLADRLAEGTDPSADHMLRPISPVLLGMNIGTLVAFLSNHVLGTFDAGFPATQMEGLTFHVPNIEDFAASNGLDNRSVRLWVSLHEVAHHTIMSRPWVRSYLTDVFRSVISSIEIEPEDLTKLHRVVSDPSYLHDVLGQSQGIEFIPGCQIDQDLADQATTAMELVEGYGTYLVERAAHQLLPNLDEIKSAMTTYLEARMGEAGPISTLRGSSSGIDSAGEGFCREVRDRWGASGLEKVWQRSENLATSAELSDATGWAARMLLEDPFFS